MIAHRHDWVYWERRWNENDPLSWSTDYPTLKNGKIFIATEKSLMSELKVKLICRNECTFHKLMCAWHRNKRV